MYDPSLAPPGKHIMGIFLQYAPYTLREGTWDELREPFGDRVISTDRGIRAQHPVRSSSTGRC